MSHTLTLIVHGTFASQASWWRLSAGTLETFADQLESELAARGLPHTVWSPALGAGFTYSDFAWSGANSHGARITAAQKLTHTLAALATTLGCTAESPLIVNFVGHSHGGNVALEALRRLKGAVRPGRIVLLGTPLVSMRPSFRLIRLPLSLVFIGMACLMSFFPVVFMVLALSGVQITDPRTGAVTGAPQFWQTAWTAPLSIFLYGAVFSFAAWFADRLWWVVGRVLMVAWGRTMGQVYGPSPRTLRALLEGRSAVLLTSRLDEADLVLQLGSAPRTLYTQWVERRSFVVRLFLGLIVTPGLVGLILRALEFAMEHFVLGFPWHHVLFFDYEMVEARGERSYRATLCVDVSDALIPIVLAKRQATFKSALAPTSEQLETEPSARGAVTLRRALQEAGEDLAAQIRLRHSAYYESDTVVKTVADAICS